MKTEIIRGEQGTILVDISSLKLWVTGNLASASNLRAVLLIEPDRLPLGEFLSKMGVWLKLAELEDSGHQRRSFSG